MCRRPPRLSSFGDVSMPLAKRLAVKDSYSRDGLPSCGAARVLH